LDDLQPRARTGEREVRGEHEWTLAVHDAPGDAWRHPLPAQAERATQPAHETPGQRAAVGRPYGEFDVVAAGPGIRDERKDADLRVTWKHEFGEREVAQAVLVLGQVTLERLRDDYVAHPQPSIRFLDTQCVARAAR